MKAQGVFKLMIILMSFCAFFVLWPYFVQAQQQDSLLQTIQQYNSLGAGEKQMLLSSVGMPGASDFTAANIMAWILFGSIGFVVFIYGKKQKNLKALLIGILLMVYPYFISGTLALYLVGIGLCVALYFFRE